MFNHFLKNISNISICSVHFWWYVSSNIIIFVLLSLFFCKKIKQKSYGRVYFVPAIEGPAACREHNFQKFVSIREMLVIFGNDELCSRRAAPATQKWSFLTIKKRLRQAASRGKWCFSPRNAILGKKKRLRQAAGRRKWCFSKKHNFSPKKRALGKPPAEGNGVFPRGTLFWAKKSACGKPAAEGNGKKHQNHHKTVICRTFRTRF